MNSNLNNIIEVENASEQDEALCFHRTGQRGCFDCFEANEGMATGFIKQLSFKNKFLLANLDYRFNRLTSKHYHMPKQFVEIIFLESIKAVNWEYDAGQFPVAAGISVFLNRGNAGKIVFFPDVPVQGIRIVVFEDFYLNDLHDRFSQEPLNIYRLIELNNQQRSAPELQLVFRQIKYSMESEVASELYYEGKIMEILYLLTSGVGGGPASPKRAAKRRLSEADLAAVRKAKRIIDERLAAAPKIAELAALTNTSATKLQTDFQSAFGDTIHSYVQKARMEKALHRMDCTNEPLYAIAKSVGCKSPSRFAEIFKKTYGMTPLEYRSFKNSH